MNLIELNRSLVQLRLSGIARVMENHVVGPRGKDSALRQWGLNLGARGGGHARRRAVVAVARKLAVLLHRIWVKVFKAGDLECQSLGWPVSGKTGHQAADSQLGRLQAIENHLRDVRCEEGATKCAADIALRKAGFGGQIFQS